MKHPFNIKSYLTFLSRNKGYTAINVFGLSISLMFVLLIGVYVYQEKSVDRENSKADRILVLGVDNNGQKQVGLHHYFGRKLAEDYPDVEAFCGIVRGCAPRFLEAFFYTCSRALHHAELTDLNVKIFLQGGKNSFQTAAIR